MKSYLLTNIIFLFSFIPSVSRGPGPLSVESALKTYYKKYPLEKIYVQTDKQVYSIGQTIWYKVYSTVYGSPATLSKIVYVQLVNRSGKIIAQSKLPLVEGKTNGDIQIPDTLQSNIYQLRCFTSWMLNFDESSLFHKDVYIKNIIDSSEAVSTKPEPERYSVQFFPEGGDLIDQITDNIAFKATDQNGMPASVHGEIKNNSGDLVDSFTTFHDGMGKFSLHADIKHSYYAIVHLPDQSTKNIPLASIKQSGINLKILEQNRDMVAIKITYHEAERDKYRNIILAACQNNGKIATYPLELDPGINLYNIPKKDFSTGILRLTIFDNNNLPQSERLVYIDKENPLQLKLTKDTVSFAPKTKSAFTIQTKGMDPKIDKANISVSVTDADRAPEDSLSDNICTRLLLSEELKGYVHNPAYYFSNKSDSVQTALDLVMMTNGWRNFEWKKILNDEPVKLNHPVEDSLYIAGELAGYKDEKKDNPTLKMIITQGDSIRFIGYVSPDSNGRFILKEYSMPGPSTIYFQDEKSKTKTRHYPVKFFTNPLDTIHRTKFVETPSDINAETFNESMAEIWKIEKQQYFPDRKGMLKAVTVKANYISQKELLANRYVSPNFQAGHFHDLDLANNFYPDNIRLFDFLKGQVPGLDVTGSEAYPSFSYHGSATQELIPVKSSDIGNVIVGDASGGGGSPTALPYFYVNEAFSSYQDIINIPLSDIALIRYIPPPASMAPFNGGKVGVIAIYLKKYDEGMKRASITENDNHYVFHGYSVMRQFYSPDYPVNSSLHSVPDNRETIYWNPDLKADANSNMHFSFYNSDHAKRFRIVAEGMDEQGHLVYLNQIIGNN
jgi:hypothetical protein